MSKTQQDLDREKELLNLAYKSVLDSKQGRMVLNDILGMPGTEKNSANLGNFKTNETFFNSGRSSVGQQLTAKLKAISLNNFVKIITNQ